MTNKELKSFLTYDPVTGIFKWKKGQRSGMNAGSVCGSSGLDYLYIKIKGKKYSAHRLAFLYMKGYLPDMIIDHVDGDGLNNSWKNLREVDYQENSRNLKKPKHNKSGIVGVGWYKKNGKYRAEISIKNKTKTIGYFDNIFDAACARISYQNKLGFHENHARR